jgi:hypothetical protein
VKEGLIEPRPADTLDAYMRAETLRRAGLIDYATNDRFEKEITDFNLDPLIDQAGRSGFAKAGRLLLSRKANDLLRVE